MTTFLLVIIYLAFISLGLPDSLLGVAWPAMQRDYSASLGTAGSLHMTIACGTIISSLVSARVLNGSVPHFYSCHCRPSSRLQVL
jgi:fucose permease